ncbi:uracil phosphoribosyltransferase [Neomegalonema sp.]|uniref:uracil phosphoribosyltransferase n=1 Tax=Neomegalonema sp. TaxID=2039713 RepID=UPI00263703AD|nr:uracil phosphoribosyltransferase [Neomegalonema sp.]MDD2869909.1 uracil phosphoribosyltransferase [Neomegalonema sp.]
MRDVRIIDHPLIQHKLTIMRDRATSTASFRRLLQEISHLLCYELTRDLELEMVPIITPVAMMMAPRLAGKKLVFASVLRAGDGLLQGMMDLVPSARVAHIGLYRDPETLQPVSYYFKSPEDLDDRLVVIVDPMLATGHSAAAAVTAMKAHGAQRLRFLSLLAAPEGLKNFHDVHPDVPVYVAAVDEKLDEKGYIVPGLGDAGDRLFGTK